MDSETRERLRSLVEQAYAAGARTLGRYDHYEVVRFRAHLDAILAPPADERTVDVEHDVIVCEDGEVFTRGLNVHGQVALREPDTVAPDARCHIVRVRYRVPLPPEPVTVDAEVSRGE